MRKLVPLLMLISVLVTGCGFAGETYGNYVTAILDCTYHNDYETYTKLTNASIQDAESIYIQEAERLTQRIYDTYGVKPDMISEETQNGYRTLAEKILQKTKYNIRDVMLTENTYTVVLVVSPIDFWQKSEEEVKTYYKGEFTRKYKKAPTRNEADKLEEEYAQKVLTILSKYAENLDYLEPVVYTFPIENTTVSSKDWQEIDKLILNL